MNEKEWHKKFAVSTFNKTWEYLEKKNLDRQEKERMIELAYTSLYHWRKAGTDVNVERGEWLLARVFAVTGEGKKALFHAEQCLKICKENGINDWDIAFAYEAVARAYAALGDEANCKKYLKLAEKAGTEIKDKEDRKTFEEELKSPPWFNCGA